jgi:UDP:flavonoid glycosyltransferase YjiC (YdhE family)
LNIQPQLTIKPCCALQALPKSVNVAELPLGSNTMLVPQVDYNDVLGHPNTRLFVSHCGLHSVYEAAFHAVPVVGVPFMFEQVRQ